ncbi:SAF domain-containing protein [Nocardia sp. BMG111209]|uniref:SAF domain-containing protein n=1 Tax=Nocardia sp. BMG111209 TaxID=1160137 RepID=UPI00036A60F2|nr:SAF domain-containing protein [Nocardia sp. BMG111209]
MLAVVFAALAVVLAVRGDPATGHVEIVVAAHDLPPGHRIAAADVVRAARPADTLPEGAIRDVAAVLGSTLGTAVRAGEVLTDLRVVGPRLAAAAAGTAEARIVAIRPADAAVADVLRPGDRVDVIAAAEDGEPRAGPPPRPLATDAAVVLVTTGDGGRGRERMVLLALDAAHAPAVAAASLRTAVALIVR